ncbi:hypothetical protein [Citricoccus alkalitolerans]|uniref:Uncharacterized protein n=1 Tax=Citricoccus alkalitolerans TaxID=246603 RepID=A0ABV8XVI3_9MICC
MKTDVIMPTDTIVTLPVTAVALEADTSAAGLEATLEVSALDQLRVIACAVSARERSNLRDDFIASRRKLFRLLAHRLCRTLGMPYATHREDVEQLVALEAVTFVDELIAAPMRIGEISNWEGLLHVRARAAVRSWADRNLSPASGMISLSRRVRQLNQLRDEMRATSGMEPTDREVESEHNRRMTATRKDAAKQGMLVTAGEFHLARPAADIHDLELTALTSEGGLLHPTEGPQLVAAVIAKARMIGGVTADVAACWLSGVYGSEGDQRVLTTREVAGQLDLPQDSAAAQIRKVRTLAKRVLAEQLGIHHA